jgi:demethylmenaquinone methyltransferase / 2-methoxy-6-polyprenyl-1,4-benzoquinol methylase
MPVERSPHSIDEVRQAPPQERVRAMFDDIVGRYDLLNTLLSFGLDRLWRRAAAREVAGAGRVLDLGCGTGDLVRTVGAGRTVGVDLSEAMLRRARTRVGRGARLVQGSAFRLPFAEGAFDGAVSGFVLRNLDDLAGAFRELARVVRVGGRVALVDITEPRNEWIRRAFDAYFRVAAPALGALVGKRKAYGYLTRSLAQLPAPARVVEMLAEAGFEGAGPRPLTGGMVTLFTAVRSEAKRSTAVGEP